MSSFTTAPHTGARVTAAAAVATAPTSQAALKHLYSVAAVRDAARRVLPRPVFDFADGGAEDERTLRRNEQAFNDVALLPRPLNGAAVRDLSVTPLRREACHSSRHCANGTGRSVLARRRMCGSAGSRSRRYLLLRQPWLGLHVGGHSRDRYQPSLDAGVRLYRSSLHARDGGSGQIIRIRSVGAYYRQSDARQPGARHPEWLFDPPALRHHRYARCRRQGSRGYCACAASLPKLTFGNYVRAGETAAISALASRMAGLLDPGLSWADVDWLRKIWSGPLLLKGILHPGEAAEAVARGSTASSYPIMEGASSTEPPRRWMRCQPLSWRSMAAYRYWSTAVSGGGPMW